MQEGAGWLPGKPHPAIVEGTVERVTLENGVSLPRLFRVFGVTDSNTPHVVVTFQTDDDGTLRCRSVQVQSTAAGREVLAADLRRVDIDAMADMATAVVGFEDIDSSTLPDLWEPPSAEETARFEATLAEFLGHPPTAEDRRRLMRELDRRMAEERRRQRDLVIRTTRRALRDGRRKITDELLRRAAEVYRAAPRSPTKAVADEFSVSHRTAGYYVARARAAGLLPPVERKGDRR